MVQLYQHHVELTKDYEARAATKPVVRPPPSASGEDEKIAVKAWISLGVLVCRAESPGDRLRV